MTRSILNPPDREKYVVGSLGKVASKNIINFAEKLLAKELPKKTAQRRKAIKDEAEAEDIIINEINSNPYALDEMPISILENLSTKNKAKIGLADEYSAYIAENTSSMIKDMSPKEVAENILVFDDDDIFEYMSTLNAKDLREFKNNLSDDDLEVFGDYMSELGPRKTKSNGGKSMLNPPEREQYFAGAKVIAELIKAGVKKGTQAYKKLDKKTKEALDKAQGITEDTPGATAKNRGAVIGKDRTAAFEKSAQTTGRLEGLGSATLLTGLGTGISSLLGSDEDSKVSYSIEDLPMEGAIVTKETKSGVTTYSNSGFKRAAQKAAKAGEDEFVFDGDSYNVMGALKALDRFKMEKGGLFDPEKTQASLAAKKAAADNNERQRLLQLERNAKARLEANNMVPTPDKVEAMVRQMEQEEMQRKMNEAAERFERQPLAKGAFPDLTGDGEVTQADVLKGRGVFNEGGGITAKEHIGAAFLLLQEGEYTDREAVIQAAKQLGKATSEEELEDLKFDIKNRFARSNENFPQETKFIPEDLKSKIDNFKLGDSTYKTFVEERENKAEGSLMMPPEGMPVDTYPNIPEDEMDEALASQLPDNEMEDDYIDYIMDEALSGSDQDYLVEALQKDDRLADILDQVILTASEFSGAGEVEGPGTGVSDSIPARLSDGEFVFTRKATDQIGAENLQQMMDDAERAYDGGYQMKAIGGYMQKDSEQQDSPLSKTDEEIKKLMMGANKMPSLQ